jgi:adenosylcobinamide amidohydrolase
MGNKSTYKTYPVEIFDDFRAEIAYYKALNCPTNTFFVNFTEVRPVISSRHGIKEARLLCICHIPDELGLYMHDETKSQFYYYEQLLGEVLRENTCSIDQTVFLSTGVQMRNLAWAIERYEELWVACFTTAGVKNNAVRIGRDPSIGIERNGRFERFGTICHIMVTNATLEPGALVSSIITLTEAKNVALQELNIRSSYDPEGLATGTGTDQAIVAAGFGENCVYVQGHTKMGEMMAKAVIRSTQEAINKCVNDTPKQ